MKQTFSKLNFAFCFFQEVELVVFQGWILMYFRVTLLFEIVVLPVKNNVQAL